VDRRGLVRLRRARALHRGPPAAGGRFAYSSLGFGLLGEALAARAGTSYEHLLAERITAPLGLCDTAVTVPASGETRLLEGRSRRGRPRPPLRDHMPAAGSIRGAQDLLRFLAAVETPPPSPPGPALRLAAEPRVALNKRFALGLGWILRRKEKPELIWHNGGTWAFRSFAAVVPRHAVAVVVLANTARSVDPLGFRIVEALSAAGETAASDLATA
jgi:serine-type D-Ala-D-Ala carboxypeptidase/endopeptidase